MAGQKRPAKPAKRVYTLRQRRTSMDETRARIMDAAVELYETIGPAGTSMSGVAERAGVTRATLYRHFQGDAELADAVIDEWVAGPAGIDTAALDAIADPTVRLQAALIGLYGSYRATEAITANLLRDAHALPAARQPELRAQAVRVREAIGSDGLPGRASAIASAILNHAVAFETWRTLSAEGLDDAAIAELMSGLLSLRAGPAGRAESRRQKPAAEPRLAKAGRPKATTGPTESGRPVEPKRPKATAGRAASATPVPTAAPAPADAAAEQTPRKAKGTKARGTKGKGGKKAKGDRKGKARGSADA